MNTQLFEIRPLTWNIGPNTAICSTLAGVGRVQPRIGTHGKEMPGYVASLGSWAVVAESLDAGIESVECRWRELIEHYLIQKS